MDEGDVVILVSVSGSTKDILDVAAQAKKRGVTTIAVTNYLKSPLVRYADYVLYNL
jgi:DNA-binding MurR/RpiR family transcriptional regulator